MKIDKYTYWKLNDVEDYDKFIAQASKEGYKWYAGQELQDATMRSGVIHLGFPSVVEVDNEDKTVSLAPANKEKFASDFKKHYKPIVPLKDEIVAIPSPEEITALSFKDSNGHTLSFTEEGVRDNLEDILKTIRKRFTSFRVGDRVKVTNPGRSYVTYSDWFEENQIAVGVAARYAYGQDVKENTVGTIRCIGKHRRENDKIICLIEGDQTWDGKPFYLVEASGLEMEEK
jgi:hypothetical protein